MFLHEYKAKFMFRFFPDKSKLVGMRKKLLLLPHDSIISSGVF